MPSLIEVAGLQKSYRQGFWMRRVEAVRNISFAVSSGSIFGFLGPNGAGKTTTIKVLTGLIRPSAGSARLFGIDVQEPAARRKLGFLPENPYVYPYLTPMEFVRMSAELAGLKRTAARDRTRHVLEQVGILYAADRPARKLSKGMLQRTGLAAALVSDPELLILDEPMSGLDPVGRKEVRDLIVAQRDLGRTLFFSTHILSDVEAICDEVAILRQGSLVVSGKLGELSQGGAATTDVVLATEAPELGQHCSAHGLSLRQAAGRSVIRIDGQPALQAFLAYALSNKWDILEVLPHHESLETLFLSSTSSTGVAPTSATTMPQGGPNG
jgi:ABC-2 type transport system ATP-binding protein